MTDSISPLASSTRTVMLSLSPPYTVEPSQRTVTAGSVSSMRTVTTVFLAMLPSSSSAMTSMT